MIKTKRNARLDAALLELAQDTRGTLLTATTADKMTRMACASR